jgi:hypothetical protein
VNLADKGSKLYDDYTSSGRSYLEGDFAAGVLGGAQYYQDHTYFGFGKIQMTQLTDKNGMHSGHGGALGQYADIRYANNSFDINEPVTTGGSNFHKWASQVMADSFNKFGFNNSTSILTENSTGNGPALANTYFADGKGKFQHQNHMHLQRYNSSDFIEYKLPFALPTSNPFSLTQR